MAKTYAGNLGKDLAEWRESLGFSLSLVAKTSGLSTGYLCDLEKGRKTWTERLETLYRESVKQLEAGHRKGMTAAARAVERKLAREFPGGIPSAEDNDDD